MKSVHSALLVVVITLQTCATGAEPGSVDEKTVSHRPVGQWQLTGPMEFGREYHGGVVLNDGRVLAVSGHPVNGMPIGSAELYDPVTSRWSATGSLGQPRNSGNAATLLIDGRVLLPGGHTNTGPVRGTELFDPMQGTWHVVGQLRIARDAPAVRLADGRVLVSGGVDWTIADGTAYATAEIYDPQQNSWTETGSLQTARYAHKTMLLGDGRVLAVGGYQDGDVLLRSCELYDPQTGTWTPTGELAEARVAFGLVELTDGNILLTGGFTGPIWRQRTNVATCTVFDPKTGQWSATDPMHHVRAGHSITLLRSGRVLVAGGWEADRSDLDSAEVYDPQDASWLPAAPMNEPRRNHRAAMLADGLVLVIGGSNQLHGNGLRSCELFRE